MMEILIKASKHKISTKSYQISINKIEKNIDQAFDLVLKQPDNNNQTHNSNEVSFFQIGEILTYLNIFRETFTVNNLTNSSSNIKSKNRNTQIPSYRDIQLELKKSKKSEMRKRTEIQFLEQLWMSLNPENNNTIRGDTVKEFLKILFSPISTSVKEVADILTKFIQATFFLNSKNLNEEKILISPLTQKPVDERDLWKIETLVKEFLNLKDNILAYKPIKNLKPQSFENLNNQNKNFTFKPTITKLNTEYSQIDFETRLKKFQESKKENISKKMKELEESVSFLYNYIPYKIITHYIIVLIITYCFIMSYRKYENVLLSLY